MFALPSNWNRIDDPNGNLISFWQVPLAAFCLMRANLLATLSVPLLALMIAALSPILELPNIVGNFVLLVSLFGLYAKYQVSVFQYELRNSVKLIDLMKIVAILLVLVIFSTLLVYLFYRIGWDQPTSSIKNIAIYPIMILFILMLTFMSFHLIDSMVLRPVSGGYRSLVFNQHSVWLFLSASIWFWMPTVMWYFSLSYIRDLSPVFRFNWPVYDIGNIYFYALAFVNLIWDVFVYACLAVVFARAYKQALQVEMLQLKGS